MNHFYLWEKSQILSVKALENDAPVYNFYDNRAETENLTMIGIHVPTTS